jgi:ribosomal protein S18 acetylase RimI-like enzyme
MPALAFHPAGRYPHAQLAALMTSAYTGYSLPVQVDAAGFASMIAAYDIDLNASRVAALGERLIAIALLGARGERGWIGGMGVAPEHRGEGIGRKIMQAVIEGVRSDGLHSIDLEVLTGNLAASRIYETLGFRRRRTLDIWARGADATFPFPPQRASQRLEVSACLAAFDELHVTAPPWQRDVPTLQRIAPRLHALGFLENGRVAAYVLYRVSDMAVRLEDAAAAPSQRATSIEAVLRALIRDRSGSTLRYINVPQDDPAAEAMRRVGANVEMQQVEMTLEL